LRNLSHAEEVELRDARYEAVFHLVTAANGAVEFYGTDTNATRYETAEVACEVDKKLQSAWIGHPRVYVFDNKTDFEAKMQRVVARVSRICGLPATTKGFRRFLLSEAPTDIPVKCEGMLS
jgi:hypothetical protein